MLNVMYTVHVLAALGLLMYIMLPFLVGGAANASTAKGLLLANRIGQYLLVIGFLTGGYMVSKSGHSYVWMALAVILILVMFATSGIASKPLKVMAKSGSNAEALRKARTFFLIAGVSYALLLTMMFLDF